MFITITLQIIKIKQHIIIKHKSTYIGNLITI